MPKKQQQMQYVMDLDEVFNFIFCPEEKRDIDVNIAEKYQNVKDADNKDRTVLVEKTRVENKSSDHSQHETIRYDLFRRLLDTFDELDFDEDTKEPLISSFTDELAFNTMFKYGFIKLI